MPPPTNNLALREAQHNRYWRRAPGHRIFPYTLILGILLAEAVLLGIAIEQHLLRGIGGSMAVFFFRSSPLAAPLGLIGAFVTYPIIYFTLRHKPLAKALIITYTPLFLIAFITGIAWPPLAFIATLIALILWPIAVAYIIPDWRPFSLCQSCNYDLSGLLSPLCPECGKPNHRHITPATHPDPQS